MAMNGKLKVQISNFKASTFEARVPQTGLRFTTASQSTRKIQSLEVTYLINLGTNFFLCTGNRLKSVEVTDFFW